MNETASPRTRTVPLTVPLMAWIEGQKLNSQNQKYRQKQLAMKTVLFPSLPFKAHSAQHCTFRRKYSWNTPLLWLHHSLPSSTPPSSLFHRHKQTRAHPRTHAQRLQFSRVRECYSATTRERREAKGKAEEGGRRRSRMGRRRRRRRRGRGRAKKSIRFDGMVM